VKLGAHVSVVGGLPRAVAAAREVGCQALQIFLRPPGRWVGRPVQEGEAAAFRRAIREAGLTGAVFAHAPYLVNLASADPRLARRSLEVVEQELALAAALELAGVVLHPGSGGRGGEREATHRLAAALETLAPRIPPTTRLVLENTAGAGGQLGASVAQLVALVPSGGGVERRFGVCLDTAHLWAAGYDLANGGWARAEEELGQRVGLVLLHLNDTPVPCGARKDRHAPPGEGALGRRVFEALLARPSLAQLPAVMEIPPGKGNAAIREALQRLAGWGSSFKGRNGPATAPGGS